MMEVKITHRVFGEIILTNITEIHYRYPSDLPGGDRIAFESDIEATGSTYLVEDILEFEATTK